MSMNATTIVIQTPGAINYLYRIREFVTGIAEEAGIDEIEIANIELAVDEACANVIEHGYPPDARNKNITIRMEIDDAKLVLTIMDEGTPFDPRHASLPRRTSTGTCTSLLRTTTKSTHTFTYA